MGKRNAEEMVPGFGIGLARRSSCTVRAVGSRHHLATSNPLFVMIPSAYRRISNPETAVPTNTVRPNIPHSVMQLNCQNDA